VDTHAEITRREALRRGGAALLGMAATACAPSFLARSLYPESAVLDESTIDATLRSFVLTVLPGVEDAGAVARTFADPTLRFAPFRAALVADLTRRAIARGACGFARLDAAARQDVIREGLEGGAVAGRLYNGGVFLAQVAYFGGLWNEISACPAIGFEGPYVFRGVEAYTWPDPDRFLPASRTRDGNPS
jgi:hypothetical protein